MITINGELSPRSTRAVLTDSGGGELIDNQEHVFEAVLSGCSMSAALSGIDTLAAEITLGGSGTPYEGDYVVTASDTVQILETKDLMMLDNITVNPVPSNYGLITWDGTTLMVS